jgi:hypothetical protein
VENTKSTGIYYTEEYANKTSFINLLNAAFGIVNCDAYQTLNPKLNASVDSEEDHLITEYDISFHVKKENGKIIVTPNKDFAPNEDSFEKEGIYMIAQYELNKESLSNK